MQAAVIDLLGVGPSTVSHESQKDVLRQALLTAFQDYAKGTPLCTISDSPKHSLDFYHLAWTVSEQKSAGSTGHSQTSTVLDIPVDMTVHSHKRTFSNIVEVCSNAEEGTRLPSRNRSGDPMLVCRLTIESKQGQSCNLSHHKLATQPTIPILVNNIQARLKVFLRAWAKARRPVEVIQKICLSSQQVPTNTLLAMYMEQRMMPGIRGTISQM